MRSCSPWIERMMQSDVTPTPCPSGPSLGISTSLSLAKRGAAAIGEVSCVASQTVDLQSCHSSGRQKSAFSCDPQHESTVDLSADFCTDDEDLDTRPVDVKRKKRQATEALESSARMSLHLCRLDPVLCLKTEFGKLAEQDVVQQGVSATLPAETARAARPTRSSGNLQLELLNAFFVLNCNQTGRYN
jgi:hypothetical protein